MNGLTPTNPTQEIVFQLGMITGRSQHTFKTVEVKIANCTLFWRIGGHVFYSGEFREYVHNLLKYKYGNDCTYMYIYTDT